MQTGWHSTWIWLANAVRLPYLRLACMFRSEMSLPDVIKGFFTSMESQPMALVPMNIAKHNDSALLMRTSCRAAAAAAVEVACAVRSSLIPPCRKRTPSDAAPSPSALPVNCSAKSKAPEPHIANQPMSTNDATIEWGESLLLQVRKLHIISQHWNLLLLAVHDWHAFVDLFCRFSARSGFLAKNCWAINAHGCFAGVMTRRCHLSHINSRACLLASRFEFIPYILWGGYVKHFFLEMNSAAALTQ